ncbi:putative NBD/HSP70 family sugar kinase [Saccharothrix tamanrassetensis]|uniref:Putative NBD/HSP70 family sugar kinase n=1 Tax=Saccharothrix tamanrassetensis TaxID=1051531 RepID=A0A841CNL2_9PSEU|nr:ROK family transcriptional regulator [Saccharothrix tamanrassetensis]MBB5957126.1 putative NBD/HSP70 family sugar kinase [Saccharothrix tamanrassetensis]
MSSGPAATGPHVLRRINATAVLNALRDADGHTATVSDLVVATGLSRPAVTRALTTLAEAGIAEFAGTTEHQIGRPAQRARFRAELGHVAGIDIGPHKVLVMVADLAGNVLAERQVATPPNATGSHLVALLRATLTEVAAEAEVTPTDLWSVAVGTPGIVDHERGEVVLAPSIPGWSTLPVIAELREWLGCPVGIENDVNLAVVAERWCGEAGANLLFVQWGERIGTGMVIDDKPYRGASSAAGELGFIDLVTDLDDEPKPPADGLGAFERLVGAGEILRLGIQRCDSPLRDRLADTGDIAPLFDAALAGDPAALSVVDTIATRFARGLAVQLLIMDPQRVVVGGGVSRAGDVLFDAVRKRLSRLLLVPIDLRVSALGVGNVALGAVRMALDQVEARLTALL